MATKEPKPKPVKEPKKKVPEAPKSEPVTVTVDDETADAIGLAPGEYNGTKTVHKDRTEYAILNDEGEVVATFDEAVEEEVADETTGEPVPTASVGPIKGTLEGKPDKVRKQSAKEPEVIDKSVVAQSVEEQFAALAKTLSDTVGVKQPRQLRWALKALEDAKDLALRHVNQNL